MKKTINRIKNFIWIILAFCIIPYLFNDVSKVYADEAKSTDYSRYYYNQLSEEAKLIYDALYSNIDNTLTGDFSIDIPIDNAVFEKMKKEGSIIVQAAMDAFDRDNPQVFWLDVTKIQISYKRNLIKLSPVVNQNDQSYLIDGYTNPEEIISTLDEDVLSVNTVLDTMVTDTKDMSDFDKVKFIHDYLVLNNEYNSEASTAYSKAYKSSSAIIGIKEGKNAPVCEGYARAFKVMCDKLNIPCVIVSGKAKVNNAHLGHMWNYVLINDKWYVIDVTWDDPVLLSGTYDELPDEKKYEYFLIGYEKEKESHIPSGSFTQVEDYDFFFEYPHTYPLNYNDDTKLYSISITKYTNGIITTDLLDELYVLPGTKVNVTVDVVEGMVLIDNSLKMNGVPILNQEFTMPHSNVVITAAFMTDINNKEDENKEDENKEENEEDNNEDNEDKNNEEQEDEAPTVTKRPSSKDEEDDKTPASKKPVKTKTPNKTEDDNNEESSTKKPPKTTAPVKATKEPHVTKTPDDTTTKVPESEDNPDDTKENINDGENENVEDENVEDDKSDVIIIEDNFEEVNPLKDIKIINKANISMVNKEVIYGYHPILNDKSITFNIGNMNLSEEEIVNIVSKEYLVRTNSMIESLHIVVYDTKTNSLVDFIDKENPLTIFIPVDNSWISKDYDEYFYLINDGIPDKKVVMIRESKGQYYLQITLETAMADYAIIRRRADGYVIPGTTSNNMTAPDDTMNKQMDMFILGTRELIIIALALIAVFLTIKVAAMQKKYKEDNSEEE